MTTSERVTPGRALAPLEVVNLGRMRYAEAYARQQAELERVRDSRESETPLVGTLLLVEHDPPVITVSRRPGAADHLLASREILAQMGVEVEQTDRGGDITYHGPGQLVAYPILDLNALNLRLHDYMRTLEDVVIRVCGAFGVSAMRDPSATGVWVADSAGQPARKIAAMGVRVRRWVSMHGLALNVRTNLAHFDLIVPCGLVGRPVTSLEKELGENAPTMDEVQRELVAEMRRAVAQRLESRA